MSAPTSSPPLDDINKRAMDAYWKSKDLSTAVTLLLDGIARGQAEAAANPAAQKQTLGSVKAMAFNVGSFTWPGWDEQGITITPEQTAVGREAATLNLELAIELDRPPDKVAAAHWLIGAHDLAARDYDAAIAQFAQQRKKEIDAADRFLSDGYTAIAQLAAGRDDGGAFDQAIAALGSLQSQDGSFFVTQLQTARRVFTGK